MIRLLKSNFSLLKSFSSYTLVNILNAGIPFLLLPFLTNYLSPADYGILSNINATFMLIVPLVGVAISGAISRQYVNEKTDLPVYISSCLRVLVLNTALLFLILLFIGDWLFELTNIPVRFLIVLPFYAIVHNIIEMVLTIFRMKNQPFIYGIFRISRTTIEITLSVFLIINFEMDWIGRFYGILIAALFGFIAAFLYLWKAKYLVFSYNKTYVKKFLHFGVPLIPHALSGALIMYSDKIIVTEMLGIGKNGVYSVAFQIGMVIALFQNSFNQAWVPFFFQKLKGKFDKQKMVKITYVYFIVLLVLALGLWLITPIIFLFINDNFAEGAAYVFWIGLGFAFNGMYKMMVNYIMYEERTKLVAVITITTAVINILLNILFIQYYGLLGAAIASTISFIVQFILSWIICARIYPMPWFTFNQPSNNQ